MYAFKAVTGEEFKLLFLPYLTIVLLCALSASPNIVSASNSCRFPSYDWYKFGMTGFFAAILSYLICKYDGVAIAAL